MTEKQVQLIESKLNSGGILALCEVRSASAFLSKEYTDPETKKVRPPRWRVDLLLEIGEGAHFSQVQARLALPPDSNEQIAKTVASGLKKGIQALCGISSITSEFGRLSSMSLSSILPI